MPTAKNLNFESGALADLMASIGQLTAVEARTALSALSREHKLPFVVPIPARFNRTEWSSLVRRGMAFGGSVVVVGVAAKRGAMVLDNTTPGTGVSALVRLVRSWSASGTMHMGLTSTDLSAGGTSFQGCPLKLDGAVNTGKVRVISQGSLTLAQLALLGGGAAGSGLTLDTFRNPTTAGALQDAVQNDREFIVEVPNGFALVLFPDADNTSGWGTFQWAEVPGPNVSTATPDQSGNTGYQGG